ncbi:MAG: HD domain-containing phosphohydrolase [bacterium]
MILAGAKGPVAERQWALDREKTLIGRDVGCDICVEDTKVSRIHCEILRDGDQYVFVDRNSVNGSFINGHRARRQIILPGDRLRIGSIEFLVKQHPLADFVLWNEADQTITHEVPRDAFCKQVQEHFGRDSAASSSKRTAGGETLKIPAATMARFCTLFQTTRELLNALSPNQLWDQITEKIFELFPPAGDLVVFLISPSGDQVTPKILTHRDSKKLRTVCVPRAMIRTALADSVGVLVEKVTVAAEGGKPGNGPISAACVPISRGEEVIGAIHISSPSSDPALSKDDLEFLMAVADQVGPMINKALSHESLQKVYHSSLLELVQTLESQDALAMGHTWRTLRYALGIAQELRLDAARCLLLREAAELHNLGRLALKANFLGQDSTNSDSQFLLVQRELNLMEKVLSQLDYLKQVNAIISSFHEKYDGTGYPQGLKGESIPLESRILALANAFDSMTSQRPHGAPLSFREALNQCRRSAATHFDPETVGALEKFLNLNYDQEAPSVPATDR